MSKKTRFIYRICLGVLSVLFFIFGIMDAFSPILLSTGEIDYNKAYEHLEVITKEKHPRGSEYHKELQGYIEDYLISLGLSEIKNGNTNDTSYEVQRAINLGNGYIVAPDDTTDSSLVVNFIVRIKGTNPGGKKLLINCHYDSVEDSFGMADDGLAVAAMLEVINYATKNPVENDVVFLINDGEEDGFIGAEAFMDLLPDNEKIGYVINFESTGTNGTLIMFESSANNKGSIQKAYKFFGGAFSSSVTEFIYDKMPNGTDILVFSEHGVPGVGFANVGDGQNYHNENDSMENFSETLFKQNIHIMYKGYKNMGNTDISDISGEGPEMHFSFFDLFVLYMDGVIATILASIMLLILIVSIVFRKKEFSLIAMLKSLLIIVSSIAVAFGATYGINRLLEIIPFFSERMFQFKFSTTALSLFTMFTGLTFYLLTSLLLSKALKVKGSEIAKTNAILIILLNAVLTFVVVELGAVFFVAALVSTIALSIPLLFKDENKRKFVIDLDIYSIAALLGFSSVLPLSIAFTSAWGSEIMHIVMLLPLLIIGLLFNQISNLGDWLYSILPMKKNKNQLEEETPLNKKMKFKLTDFVLVITTLLITITCLMVEVANPGNVLSARESSDPTIVNVTIDFAFGEQFYKEGETIKHSSSTTETIIINGTEDVTPFLERYEGSDPFSLYKASFVSLMDDKINLTKQLSLPLKDSLSLISNFQASLSDELQYKTNLDSQFKYFDNIDEFGYFRFIDSSKIESIELLAVKELNHLMIMESFSVTKDDFGNHQEYMAVINGHLSEKIPNFDISAVTNLYISVSHSLSFSFNF